nr:hypothetical protein [Tanacetum cinerariifolium]
MSNHEDETINEENTPSKVVPQITTVTNISTKFPYRKKGEYDIWVMKRQNFFSSSDLLCWTIILKGNNAKFTTTDNDGNMKIRPPVTAEEHQQKTDAAEGFEQIINFLSGSYIHYALTVNPHIYISCIKQFWNTASVKRSDDVTRLQALVDRKKIVISEDVIREILQLDDAEGVNQVGDLSTHTTRFNSPALTQKVFANMRRVGKGFSGIETPLLEGMLAARQLAEEGIAEEQVQADDAVAAAVQENVAEDGAEFPTHFQQVLDTCSALTRCVENLEHDKAAQKLEIIKLKARVKKLERANKVKSSKLRRLRKVGASKQIESSDDMEDVFNQGRMINDLDKDEGIELVADQVKDANIAKTKGRHAAEQAEKQAEIYHLDLDHPSKVLSMQEDDSKVQEVVEVVTTAKLITDVVTAASQVSAASATISATKPSIPAAAPTVVTAYTRRRKGVIIRDPKEELSSKTLAETLNLKDKGKVMKKRPQTESEARKNMMIYLKNTAGYKMDFFKGMSYDEICPIFQARFYANMRFLFKSREEMEEEDQEVLKSINETPAQKAAKRRKLNEEAQEAEDLKKRLEVVDDEDDDVFTEATPLARKVPVVDYHILLINNKPRFKIIKADETHQLYISFITLLKNFDREYLESLWGIVKERFSTSKPTNFFDEYLLTTLKTIFEKPDGQDVVWKSQKSVHDVVTATSQVSAASATISAAKPSIPAAAPTVVAAYTRRRKSVIIRDPKEELSSKIPAETPKLKEKGKCILIETPKPMKKKDQIELDAKYARKLHEEINEDHKEINKDID